MQGKELEEMSNAGEVAGGGGRQCRGGRRQSPVPPYRTVVINIYTLQASGSLSHCGERAMTANLCVQ